MIKWIYLLLLSSTAQAKDAEWSRLYEEDGITVFANKSETLPEFKAEGRLDLNFYELLAVLNDIPRRVEWVENLAEIRTLTNENTEKLVVYNRFDLPWPASDRDSIVKADIQI